MDFYFVVEGWQPGEFEISFTHLLSVHYLHCHYWAA